VLDHLKLWHNIGALNEENIENAHAIWNGLMRQFGTVRGARKKELVLREFLYRGAIFVHEALEEMKKNTARKKGPKAVKNEQKTSSDTHPETSAVLLDDEEEDQDEECPGVNLTESETKINETPTLHNMTGENTSNIFDTKVTVCPCCHKRMLGGMLSIHMHESHSAENTCCLKEENN